MQASLRNNYQYYDYGTLDCSTRHLASQHQLSGYQLEPAHQMLPDGGHFEQQAAAGQQHHQSGCYGAEQPPLVGAHHEQLVVYDQYQLVSATGHQHQLTGAEQVNLTSQEVEHLYQQHQHQQPQQHAYQTIYYEPISFAENCQVEPALDEQGQFGAPVAFGAGQPAPADESCTYYQQYGPSADGLAGRQQESPLAEQRVAYPSEPAQVEATSELAEQQQLYQPLEPFGLLERRLSSLTDQPVQAPAKQLEYQELEPKGSCNQQLCYLAAPEPAAYSQELELDGGQLSPAASSSSSEESEESACSTLTRDERRAREANIPLSYYEIVNLSIDQFNEHLAKYQLSESQLTLIKDIRRRGKNKVAAQSCRKRKMEQIYELQHEVGQLTGKRRALACEHGRLVKEHGSLLGEYERIYAAIQVASADLQQLPYPRQ